MKRSKIFLRIALHTLVVAGLLLATTSSVFAHSKLEPRLTEMDSRLQRIELLLENGGLQELYREIEKLDQENRSLRGDLEEANFRMEQLKTQQREFFIDLDERIEALESRPADPFSIDPDAAIDPANGDSGATLAPQDEADAYKVAFEQLKREEYKSATQSFNSFLTAYPTSVYAPNAQYWLAESHYVSGKYEQAVSEFEKVRNNYPSSPKAADATVKLGFSYLALKQDEKARTFFEEATTRFPGSQAADLASTKLSQMN